MNKEISSIKKRLQTQIEHRNRYIRYADGADTTDKEDRYLKEVNKANEAINYLHKEFISTVGRYSKIMSEDTMELQWEMIVQEVEGKAK